MELKASPEGSTPTLACTGLSPWLTKRESVDQRFGDGLDGKRDIAVADVVDLSIDGGNGNAEPFRSGVAKLWDVVGDFAVLQAGVLVMKTLNETLDGRGKSAGGKIA